MKTRLQPVQTPLKDVKGKTAFITGGSSGIGLGIARALSAAGMKVAFSYLSEQHRDQALSLFPAGNPGVLALRLNTTDRDGMARAADEVEAKFGKVHLLVNNAGVGVPALISSVSWQDWEWALDVNVNGVFNGVRTFLPRILAHGEGGHIMVTSSSAGIVAGTLGVYCTTKFAVVGMFESLRTEMAGRNVGVSIYCPGLVRTDIFNTDRNRPDSHGPRAAARPPPLKPGAVPVDLMGVAMDPLEAGEQVLAGLRRNDLYILSHPEFKPAARERFQLMMDSFSTKPVPAGRRIATETFTPDIYAADLAKRRARKTKRSKPEQKKKKKVSRAKPARPRRPAARRPR